MPSPRIAFEQALLTDRVATRASHIAMEHDSPEALAKYLQEHPDADKAKHTVKKRERKAPKKNAPKKDAPKDDGLDKALAKASPHKLRDKADADEKAGRYDKAFESYMAAAEVFRSRGDHAAAKSMDSAAKSVAKKYEQQKR